MKACTVDGCSRDVLARDLCIAHYNRWQQYGETFPERPVRIMRDPVTRFWSKVNKDADGGCWEWTAGTRVNRHGASYGRMAGVPGYPPRKQVLAHRIAWEWASVMGKKAQRIAELEREVARPTGELATERLKVQNRDEVIRAYRAAGKPSLRDAAKREFHDKWAWLLDALGVPS